MPRPAVKKRAAPGIFPSRVSSRIWNETFVVSCPMLCAAVTP